MAVVLGCKPVEAVMVEAVMVLGKKLEFGDAVIFPETV